MSDQKDKKKRRPIVFGAIVGLALGLATAAIAAAITLTTATSIGAGQVSVTSCDTTYQVDLGTPVWNASENDFVVVTATFSGVDPAACAGEFVKVEVLAADNSSLANGTASVGGSGSGSITLSQNVKVSDIDRLSSVIYTP